MSQFPLSGCPRCAEPLEEEDLFCGGCGADLQATTLWTQDHPTVPIGGLPLSGHAPPETRGHASPVQAPAWNREPTGTPSGPASPLTARPTGVDAEGDPTSASAAPDQPPGPRRSGEEYEEDWPAEETINMGADPRGSRGRRASAQEPAEPERAPEPGGPSRPDEAGERTPAAPEPPRAATFAAGSCVACGRGAIDPDGYCEHCGHAQPKERDHVEQELRGLAAASDRGLRHHRNEDSFDVSVTPMPGGGEALIAVVCDGVSSATRPDEASEVAARAARSLMAEAIPAGGHPQTAMHDAVMAASEAVNSLAREGDPTEQNAPACTIVSAVIVEGILTVGWVGDSRAYWVPQDRSARPARLTEDDSWAAHMVGAGLMTEADAYSDPRAHAITGWLGADAYEVEPHTASFKPDRPGVVIVCTDGLWNYAESADDMAAAVPEDAGVAPLRAARRLVGYALDGGGHDNVTVAVLPFVLPEGAGERP
ncbi:protein phosphatase 2C domain-containing protein [Streptomyces sp. NPDC005438]|uniref:protein phosphatase 2C domain-containing protein n=1 Tax=Streptomyces sp. NPDC005438 TaxID=3156880 RepID=UPI0033A0BA15